VAEPVLRVTGLTKEYLAGRRTPVRALGGVDLEVSRGSTLAVVGESGCGKTTLARCVIGAVAPTAGRIELSGQEITSLRGSALRRVRARLGFVQQNPTASLDPMMRVREVVAEPLRTHTSLRGGALEARIRELVDLVSLRPQVLDQRPSELSGGQAQRVAVARAIALGPELLVLDEPTSALDLSVQAQILNLLLELQGRLSLTYVLISHDLDVVEHLADEVAVMYLGRIVERAHAAVMRPSARHPYTVALFSATPSIRGAERRERIVLRGDVPNPASIPTGCPFRSRCWLWERLGRPEVCAEREPDLSDDGQGHAVACHFADQVGTGAGVLPGPDAMPQPPAP
jgi:oligopeptide/dipeptide ABC transporter ATP-binding protein